MVDSASTSTHSVHGYRWGMWRDSGRENGPLKYPVAEMEDLPDGWIQRFQTGCTVVSTTTRRCLVHNYAWLAWVAVGRETGPARLPDGRPRRPDPRHHPALPARRAVGPGRPARCSRCWGAVLDAWLAAGGAGGSYGFPTAHVVDNGDGTHTGAFESGTITA